MDSQTLENTRTFSLCGIMISDRCFAAGTINIIEADPTPAIAISVSDDAGNRSSILVIPFDDVYSLKYYASVNGVAVTVPFPAVNDWLVQNSVEVEVSQQETISVVVQLIKDDANEFKDLLRPIWSNFRSCSATGRISMAQHPLFHVGTTAAPTASDAGVSSNQPPLQPHVVHDARVDGAGYAAPVEDDTSYNHRPEQHEQYVPSPSSNINNIPHTTTNNSAHAPSSNMGAPSPVDVAAQEAGHQQHQGIPASLEEMASPSASSCEARGRPTTPVATISSQCGRVAPVAAIRTPPFGAKERPATPTPSRSPPRKRKPAAKANKNKDQDALPPVVPPVVASKKSTKKAAGGSSTAKSGTLMSIISKMGEVTPTKPASLAASPTSNALLRDPGTESRKTDQRTSPEQHVLKKQVTVVDTTVTKQHTNSPFDFGDLDFVGGNIAADDDKGKKRTRSGAAKNPSRKKPAAPRGAKQKVAAMVAALGGDEAAQDLAAALATEVKAPSRRGNAGSKTAAGGRRAAKSTTVAVTVESPKHQAHLQHSAATDGSNIETEEEGSSTYTTQDLSALQQPSTGHLARVRTALSTVPSSATAAGRLAAPSMSMRAPSVLGASSVAPSLEEQEDLIRMLSNGLDAINLKEFVSKSVRLVEKRNEATRQQARECAAIADFCNKVLQSCSESSSERRKVLISTTTNKLNVVLTGLEKTQHELSDVHSAMNTRMNNLDTRVTSLTSELKAVLTAFTKGARKMEQGDRNDVKSAADLIQQHFAGAAGELGQVAN